RDLHAEEPRQRLQADPNPCSAVIVGIARERIDPAEEGPGHHALHTVIDPDFIRDHDLRAIPPCHARMLPFGSRSLGPVGRRPSQRHDGQTYQWRSRSTTTHQDEWVAPFCSLSEEYDERTPFIPEGLSQGRLSPCARP